MEVREASVIGWISLGSALNATRIAQLYRGRFCGPSLQLFPLAGHPLPFVFGIAAVSGLRSYVPACHYQDLMPCFFFLLIMIPSIYSPIPRS
ncbi:hypothetical protein BO78DRAFT_243573 [Aspergillus sclerotiicarbonarius CBS 121057]|uniref:Uncharacterized protein n=1 Tax=Aspergillus sclerotiicarbonarius (strain CBS 121057 / IBT 28362) TaxID=1448318 RepID=A0A319ED84_ASPSB|nr:hypothetical protein BO78DRAFT_243573 [Aspergillus sclerotiicarbonarius CBS 121057]